MSSYRGLLISRSLRSSATSHWVRRSWRPRWTPADDCRETRVIGLGTGLGILAVGLSEKVAPGQVVADVAAARDNVTLVIAIHRNHVGWN